MSQSAGRVKSCPLPQALQAPEWRRILLVEKPSPSAAGWSIGRIFRPSTSGQVGLECSRHSRCHSGKSCGGGAGQVFGLDCRGGPGSGGFGLMAVGARSPARSPSSLLFVRPPHSASGAPVATDFRARWMAIMMARIRKREAFAEARRKLGSGAQSMESQAQGGHPKPPNPNSKAKAQGIGKDAEKSEKPEKCGK